jgi:hypothetical protein
MSVSDLNVTELNVSLQNLYAFVTVFLTTTIEVLVTNKYMDPSLHPIQFAVTRVIAHKAGDFIVKKSYTRLHCHGLRL